MDEERPSTSWTDLDDGPLKIKKYGRRWTGGQMDEISSVEAWTIPYRDAFFTLNFN